MTEYTTDSIWNKNIQIVQSKNGYRFGLDPVLLAHFINVEPSDRILEIGTGNGVVPVLLAQLKKFSRFCAVEIQPALAALARQNIASNKLQNVELLEADMRDLHFPSASFDLMLCNPPYRKAGSGKLNPNTEKAIARHELRMRLADLFECAGRYVKPSGRLSVILPVFREREFEKLTKAHGFVLSERQYVHSFATEPPAFFLATVARTKQRFRENPRLIIYESAGVYTLQIAAMLTETESSGRKPLY